MAAVVKTLAEAAEDIADAVEPIVQGAVDGSNAKQSQTKTREAFTQGMLVNISKIRPDSPSSSSSLITMQVGCKAWIS